MLHKTIARALNTKTSKRIVAACAGAAVLLGVLLWPGLPWSEKLRLNLRRAYVKAEVRIARWRGAEPRLASIAGRLARTGAGANTDALAGARVLAVESTSQYGALSDVRGEFLLPHLMWYPGAEYTLIIAPGVDRRTRLTVSAPPSYPEGGVIKLGELRLDGEDEVAATEPGVRPMDYDDRNDEFYRALFDQLTSNAETDRQKLEAINRYVATRLNYKEPARSFESPRLILERGSAYCVNMASAMAALTVAGKYPTRVVHLSDTPEYSHTHTVVEIHYADQWHVFDPTWGLFFLNNNGVVASYKELRLNPGLITPAAFQRLDREASREILEWMPRTYGSGIHQLYQVQGMD
ncbi:MAG TPA: transglutaminase-like domain-containing protein [Blastocatellia bacterium]|nr:transglutaminase-like domain-containing protein [Blastocatellia bacterium]